MILFQLLFEVPDTKRTEFEETYATVFLPALSRQQGFQNARLLRLYPPATVAEIGAAPTEHNYQINFVFESEQARRKWAASADHDVAWPRLSAIATKAVWRGYDLIAG
jgi:heme-degrading monooxygenase HmoA